MNAVTRVFCIGIMIAGLLQVAARESHGGVIVFDRVTRLHRSIYLKVLTRGAVFPRGGCRVTLSVGGEMVGYTLTGGDGYGFLKYTPRSVGLKRIDAGSSTDTGSGLLLVMASHEKAVVLELESGLREMLFSGGDPRQIRMAIRSIKDRFRVIYLSRTLGSMLAKSLLTQSGLPESVVLDYLGPGTFKMLKEKGVRLHAIVGSGDTLSAVGADFDKAFSFEKSRYGKTVKNWQEILENLNDLKEK